MTVLLIYKVEELRLCIFTDSATFCGSFVPNSAFWITLSD